MHVALMEPTDSRAAGQVGELCAASGTSLHVIGPVEFPLGELEGQEAAGGLDLWVHPDWFEFRRAIARERCYYFSSEGGKDLAEARLRPTSVLMFSATGELPPRIREKYPHRLYRLPAEGVDGVRAVLQGALEKIGAPAELPEVGSAPAAKKGSRGGTRGGGARRGRGRAKR
ncbi:MAG TPA: hypothetical protein VFS07_07520 [Gemmatimonadales bacterium]|nr:hypothetical protein [Gemmatimonadales bacterium]